MNQPKPIPNNATRKYALGGFLFGLLFPIGATIARILSMRQALSLSNVLDAQSADSLLWIIDTAPVFLSLFAGFAGYRQDRIQKLYAELVHTEKELRNIQITLEERVEQRARDLTIANQNANKRADQLKTIAEIARTVIKFRALDELLHEITKLIGERLGFYHIGIFLLDESHQFASFQASNSEGGQRMLARHHRLKVGEQGIVGFVTSRGEPRIALNVGEDAIFFNNPDLPETHSEIALPLKFGTETIGALDIQSTEPNAFTQDDVEILSILADQVSVAIQNARSLEQSQRALVEAELASSQLTGLSWRRYAETIRVKGYRYDGVKPEPLKQSGKYSTDHDALSVPVQLRGQTIGRLKLKTSDTSHKLSEDEMAIIESTAERVALALEGARLLEDAQKRAARETLISELAAKLGTSFQMDSILRDTVEELGQTLKGSTVTFQLVNPSAPAQTDQDDNGPTRRKKSE